MKSFVSFFVLLLATLVSAISSTGNRLLVILDDLAEKSNYSKFLGDLEGRGFSITYETPKSDSLSLFHLGELAYDHVVFFPSKSKGLGPNLTPSLLLKYINQKGNILLALSSGTATPTSLVSLLSELDIQLPAERTGLVVDHFNYDVSSAADMHDVVLLPPPGSLRPDIKDFFGAGAAAGEVIAFPRGAGVGLGAGELLTPILRASKTAYMYNPKEQAEVVDDLFAAGEQLALVATAQARNSARFTVIGSAEMLADTWFDASVKKVGEKSSVKTFNREFAKRVSGWTFQEIGVLRVNWIEHHLNEKNSLNESNPSIYRIKNDVTYSASLSEWSWTNWEGFTVPSNDVLQLEFSMLSPFHRLPLVVDESQSTKEATVYTSSFKLPDQHGIFNFMLEYRRSFFTNLEEKRTVSVRHMAHDEWPRSYVISGAWPWIAGIGATVTGWLAFCALFMYSAPTQTKESKKTQ